MSGQPHECRDRGHDRLKVWRRSLAADIQRFLNKSPENQMAGDTFKSRLGALLTPQLLCLVGYRTAHLLYARGWRRTAWVATWMNFLVHKVWITPQSCIGPGCMIPHPATVSFHGRAGEHLTLYAQSHCGPSPGHWPGGVEDGPRLGDRVSIGGHGVVTGAIDVGEQVKIGPQAVLDGELPANRIVISSAMRGHVRPAAHGETPTTDNEL